VRKRKEKDIKKKEDDGMNAERKKEK